jgi:hypothetical protein
MNRTAHEPAQKQAAQEPIYVELPALRLDVGQGYAVAPGRQRSQLRLRHGLGPSWNN